MKPDRIYVYQYEAWWSFRLAEWKDFVEKVIDNKGEYSLPDDKRLKNQPKVVKKDSYEFSDGFYAINPRYVVVQPLDW